MTRKSGRVRYVIVPMDGQEGTVAAGLIERVGEDLRSFEARRAPVPAGTFTLEGLRRTAQAAGYGLVPIPQARNPNASHPEGPGSRATRDLERTIHGAVCGGDHYGPTPDGPCVDPLDFYQLRSLAQAIQQLVTVAAQGGRGDGIEAALEALRAHRAAEVRDPAQGADSDDVFTATTLDRAIAAVEAID